MGLEVTSETVVHYWDCDYVVGHGLGNMIKGKWKNLKKGLGLSV